MQQISEQLFGKLLSSNEWTMAQATALGDFICEQHLIYYDYGKT